jgi:hypothetical protein
MKYCYNCSRITIGQPLFCNFCGRSYDYKLCPRHHPNPRAAHACSQCGSRELSTPGPPVPVLLRPFLFLLTVLPGLLLLGLSLAFLAAFVQAFLTSPELQGRFVVLALLLGLLWFLYLQLPSFLRKGIQKLIGRKKDDGHGH